MSEPLLTLYAVQNKDGQYFQGWSVLSGKGVQRVWDTWVADLKRARIYPRPGSARAQVTFFANNYPQFGVPKLVALNVTEVIAVDETVRVKKSQSRKAKEEAERARRHAQWEKDQAQKKLDEAQSTLRRLKQAEEAAEQRRLERTA